MSAELKQHCQLIPATRLPTVLVAVLMAPAVLLTK